MNRRDAVTMLAEQGLTVLCAALCQDPEIADQFRVIRGLALNAHKDVVSSTSRCVESDHGQDGSTANAPDHGGARIRHWL